MNELSAFLAGGVAVNLLSYAVVHSPVVWISGFMFMATAIATMPWGGGGMLRWEDQGSRKGSLVLAAVLVVAFLMVTGWASYRAWSLPVLLIEAVLLWGTAVLACWQTVREGIGLAEAALYARVLRPPRGSVREPGDDLRIRLGPDHCLTSLR